MASIRRFSSAKRPSARLLACMVIVVALLAVPAVAPAAPQIGVVGSNVLVRPTDAPATSASARLLAAGNEFESFQVVVRASDGAVTGLDVDVVGALQGPGGVSIPASAITTYRVGYYNATGFPSDGELGGALGRFPDVLIPRRDTIWGEARNAFPIDVPAGENRLAWIDVLVPASAPTGVYAGAKVRVSTAGGQVIRELPIELTVADLTLPSTSSLDGGFDVNVNNICGAHNCSAMGGSGAAVTLYERVALDNRVTLARPASHAPSGPLDASYLANTRSLMRGTGGLTRLPGARLTTLTLSGWSVESADEWRRIAEADGFTDRVRFHCDEIAHSASAWSTCRSDWTRANALWRGAASGSVTDLPLQVTTSVDDVAWARANGFSDLVDRIAILIPVINRIHPKSIPAFPGRRAEFAPWTTGTTPGGAIKHLWTYTSCMSMGCSPAAADNISEWDGWPSYGVDQPATEARALGWVAFEYDLDGEWYYETARDLRTAWTNLWSADGGNHGDGTLLYPGTVAQVGGTHDVPIESIRLKRIRDGREDHEWLLAASRTAGRATALSVARQAFPSAFDTNVPPARIATARDQLAQLVAGRGLREGGDATTGSGVGGEAGGGTSPTKSHVPRVYCAGRRATIVGTERGEVLRGTKGADVIVALGGNDKIYGLGGADVICAGAGNDVIVTSGDRLTRDIVVCGSGRDVAVFDRRDKVYNGCERRLRRR